MKIRLWVREDLNEKGRREDPKAIPCDATTAKGPGRIFDVEAPNATEARAVLAVALAKEPDRKTQRAQWRAWEDAMERVLEVTRSSPPPHVPRPPRPERVKRSS